MRPAICLTLFFVYGCGGTRSLQLSPGSCTAEDTVVSAFGPQLHSSDSGRVHSSVLSADGTEFYFFTRVGPREEDYRIYRSRLRSARWSAPELVDLAGDHSDLYPALSPDGHRLVFSSYRPAPGDTTSHRNAHLWYSTRAGDAWNPPRFISASAYGHYHAGVAYTRHGVVQFNRITPDWRSRQRYEIRWVDGAFTQPTVAESHAATTYWRPRLGDSLHLWDAVAAPDGWALVAVSKVLPGGGRSPAHYYVSHPISSGWSDLVPAGGGLSDGAPNFAWFSTDGCYVHYTRDYAAFVRAPVHLVDRPRK